MISYDIERKNGDDLTVFEGRITKYEKWAERFVEHLASTCSRWRHVLDGARKATEPIYPYQLAQTSIDGYN